MNPEQINPYGGGGDKSRQVEAMFDSIAPAYDFMNTAMTFGMHRHWRDKALTMLADRLADMARFGSAAAPLRLLDVACGTGDVTFRLYDILGPGIEITGVDLSAGMLKIARQKLEKTDAGRQKAISFSQADCLALPYAADTFDAATVAYGVRNFSRLADGYAELYRVLKPGGVLCVIELCEPVNPLMRRGYRLYARHIIPAIGRRISKDSRAYSYLPESIAACPHRQSMAALMKSAGFTDITWRALFPGAVAIYLATKPI